jgi:hypothetical protein
MKIKREKSNRIRQGDIYKNVEYIESVRERAGDIEILKIEFPLVIVLTQDCDLEQDFKFRYGRKEPKPTTQDKYLLSVLVAPLYNVEHVYLGQHLDQINIKMQLIDKKSTLGSNLRSNQTARYHYLEFPPEVPIVPSVIDFKHYFSVNVEYLKNIQKDNFICSVSPLYREDISLRFANFLSRIGLPA